MFLPPPPTNLHRLLTHPSLTVTNYLSTHQPPISPPPALSPPISIVCISDTHNAQPALPDGDILIHAGDLTRNGTFEELQKQLEWLNALPHGHKVVVAGNHDLVLDEGCYSHHGYFNGDGDGGVKRKGDVEWGAVQYLQETSLTLTVRGREVRLWGSPMTPRYGNWAFQYASGVGMWRGKVPQEPDVLVTHGACKSRLDGGGKGCVGLLGEVWRVRPRLHVHGHVHAGRGVEVCDWGVVQWCCDGVVRGEGGVRTVGYAGLAVVAWLVLWARYILLGVERKGEMVVVNAAWEENEQKGVTVVTI